ncbi:hypothetical protein [Bosea sp. Tri-49]|uniref:hypothetical protein n=1 Tax=Bosea sp. Tri-49 TaxID=1867715 RepID=UPI003FA45316
MPAYQQCRFVNGSGNAEDGRHRRPLPAIRGQAGANSFKADVERMERFCERVRTDCPPPEEEAAPRRNTEPVRDYSITWTILRVRGSTNTVRLLTTV